MTSRVLWLARHDWAAVHVAVSLLFVLAGLAHLALNRKTLWGYVRRRTVPGLPLKWELLLALVVTGGLVAAAVWGDSPLRRLVARGGYGPRGGQPRRRRAGRSGCETLPAGRDEDSTLADVARRLGLTGREAVEALRNEGFVVQHGSATIGRIAKDSAVRASDVLEVLAEIEPAGGRGEGRGGGRGGGRRGGEWRGGRRQRDEDE